MKKLLVALTAFTLIIAVNTPAIVDAKPRGGAYTSPKKSFNPTNPNNSARDGVKRTEPAKSTTNQPGTTTPTGQRGLGGGLMKGLLIGGLAGMLFGGLLGNLGFLGNILGFMVNMLALIVLFILVRKVVMYFIDRNRSNKKRYQE